MVTVNDMTALSLEPLYCPFEPIDGGFSSHMETKVKEWTDEYRSLPDHLKASFKKSAFGELTCLFFPRASRQMLEAAGRHILLFFVFDDLHGFGKNAHEIQGYCEEAILTLEGHAIKPENDVLHQFEILRAELLAISSPEWLNRYIHDVKKFFDSIIASSYFNATGHYPTVDYYMILREDLVGLFQLMGWVELSAGVILPHHIYSHPHNFRLRKLATRIMAWANDYYSAAKEYQDNEYMNLVLVIKDEYKKNLKDAYNMAAQIHNDEMKAFIALCDTPPDFGEEYSYHYQLYMDNLKQMILGNKLWSERTYRYAEQFESIKPFLLTSY
ncbi:terpene synthase family protein [Chitinophaga sp. RAB17]|uniref:terpene synthase family protein n=1 Tax=Chitinophaga sp. RAB17 TaxID=3233049 RepID=UPI003F93E4A9